MPRFAANLTMMFTEHDPLDRFQAAADAGFAAVEMLFPYAHDMDVIAKRKQAAGLEQVLFNLPPGDWDAGERGMACLSGREAEFEAGVAKALAYAEALECPMLHMMAGLAPAGAEAAQLQATYRRNLAFAADAVGSAGRSLCIEPINARDMPGFYLRTTDQSIAHLDAVGKANAWLQFDVYHCQISEGDLTRRMERLMDRIGHVQIAGVPDRHEPDEGEVAYGHVFAAFDRLGYQGWIGCEYRPKGKTTDGLGWLRPYS
ncbi:MAG: hydroxypyruvate isomerase [Geminicoccaceae bacterium]|nr:MAG: hydroxypyruvate isomerase [Geminicoccaceae bacterium]